MTSSFFNNQRLFCDNPPLSRDKGTLLKSTRHNRNLQNFYAKFGSFKKLSYLCTQHHKMQTYCSTFPERTATSIKEIIMSKPIIEEVCALQRRHTSLIIEAVAGLFRE